jgi:hypothetical protein
MHQALLNIKTWNYQSFRVRWRKINLVWLQKQFLAYMANHHSIFNSCASGSDQPDARWWKLADEQLTASFDFVELTAIGAVKCWYEYTYDIGCRLALNIIMDNCLKDIFGTTDNDNELPATLPPEVKRDLDLICYCFDYLSYLDIFCVNLWLWLTSNELPST